MGQAKIRKRKVKIKFENLNVTPWVTFNANKNKISKKISSANL